MHIPELIRRVAACAIAILSIEAPAVAQNVTVAISTLTPVTLQATLGAQQNQTSMPAGPLPMSGWLTASVPFPYTYFGAEISWSRIAGPVFSQATLSARCSASGVSGVTATTGQIEFLVELTGSAPGIQGFLDLLRTDTVLPGSPYPLLMVDVDNDGTIDFPNVPANSTVPIVFGPSPKLVRVVMAAHLPGPGEAGSELRVRARPDNALSVGQNAAGCVANGLQMEPVFPQRGLRLHASLLGGITLFVVGMSQQPLLLPTQYGLPCLLVPSPDIVLIDATGELTIPLPASLRPITFHVQAVQYQFPPYSPITAPGS